MLIICRKYRQESYRTLKVNTILFLHSISFDGLQSPSSVALVISEEVGPNLQKIMLE